MKESPRALRMTARRARTLHLHGPDSEVRARGFVVWEVEERTRPIRRRCTAKAQAGVRELDLEPATSVESARLDWHVAVACDVLNDAVARAGDPVDGTRTDEVEVDAVPVSSRADGE